MSQRHINYASEGSVNVQGLLTELLLTFLEIPKLEIS